MKASNTTRIDVKIDMSPGNGIVILMTSMSALIVPHNLKCKHLTAGGGLTLSGTFPVTCNHHTVSDIHTSSGANF